MHGNGRDVESRTEAAAPSPEVSDGPGRRVEDQLCFALYSASRAVTAFYRPMLDRLGVTYPQYLVLLSLWERDGRTVKDLGGALQLDYGTLSPLLKRMEAAGLVRRERRADDERSVRIRLTERARGLDVCAESVMREVIRATGLDADALEDMRAALTTLADTVSGATGTLTGEHPAG